MWGARVRGDGPHHPRRADTGIRCGGGAAYGSLRTIHRSWVERKPDAPSGVRKVTAATIRAEWNRMGFGRENGGGSCGESAVGGWRSAERASR